MWIIKMYVWIATGFFVIWLSMQIIIPDRLAHVVAEDNIGGAHSETWKFYRDQACGDTPVASEARDRCFHAYASGHAADYWGAQGEAQLQRQQAHGY